jgi:MFS family permease
MITEACSAPLFAPLADRYGRRPVFLSCVFLWGVGAIAFGLVKSVLAAVAMRGFCKSPTGAEGG